MRAATGRAPIRKEPKSVHFVQGEIMRRFKVLPEPITGVLSLTLVGSLAVRTLQPQVSGFATLPPTLFD